MQDQAPPPPPEDQPQRRWLRRTLRIGAGLGLTLAGATVILGWVVRFVVKEQLIPQAQAQLETILERPVQIGDPQVIVPWSIALGPSEVERLASVNAIKIQADLGSLLTQGRLGVNAQITRPQLSLDTPIGSNLTFNVDTSGGGGALPLGQLDVEIVDGAVVISTTEGSQPLVQGIQAQAQLHLPRGQGSAPAATSPFQISGEFQEGPFQIDGSADLQQGRGSARIMAQQVSLEPVPLLLPEDSPITILGGDVDLNVQFDFAGGGPLQFEGEVDLSSVSVGVEGLPFPLTEIQGTVLAQQGGQRLQLADLEARYGQIPIQVSGSLVLGKGENGGLDLQISIPRVSLAQLQEGFDLRVPVSSEGDFQANLQVSGTLDNPRVTGDIRSLTSGRIDQVPLSDLVAEFTFENQQIQVQPIQLQLGQGQVQGSAQIQLGDQISAQGQVDLRDLDLDVLAADYGVEVPYRLGKLGAQVRVDAPQLQPDLEVQWQISEGDLQGQGQIQWAAGQLEISENQIALGQAQGQIQLDGRYDSGRVQGELVAEGIDLSLLRSDLEGIAEAQFSLEGEAETLDLAGVRVDGSLTLPEGIQAQLGEQGVEIADPITSQLAWTGAALRIDELQLGELGQAQGQIEIDPESWEIGELDLAVVIPGLDLLRLPLPELVDAVGLAGVVQLEAQVQGSLEQPRVSGDLALSGLQVAGLGFDDLQGPIQWQPQEQGGGMDLQATVAENPDQITLQLSPDLEQIDLTLQQDQIRLTGERSGSQAQLSLAQFPLGLIGRLAGQAEADTLAGDLFADLAIDLEKQTAQGAVTVETLRLAQIEVSEVGIDLGYQDGVLNLNEAKLQLFESLYQASGTLTLPMVASAIEQIEQLGSAEAPTADPSPAATDAPRHPTAETTPDSSDPTADQTPELNLEITTNQSRLQDIVSTFKWKTWEDVSRRGISLPPLGPATILVPTDAKGEPDAALLAQLQNYLRVLRHQFEADANQEQSPLPPPTSIQGDFGFQAQISGPLTQPVVDLDFQGQNWQGEEFQIQTVQIEALYADQLLTLEPLIFSYDERSLRFEGQLGLESQSGTLEVTDLPLGTLQRFLPEQVSLVGDFNTELDLMGNLRDPEIKGSFSVNDTVVNQVPIQKTAGQIEYDAGLWTIDSRILIAPETQPVQIRGSLPYALPLSEVEAQTEQVNLDLLIEDEALRLINAFTDQVSWQAGESQIDVALTGTLTDPFIQGSLTVSDGVLQVAALADPITALNGQVDFNLSLLEVPEFTAQVGSGTISAAGQLPINSRGAFSQRGEFQPLTLQLNQVDLNIPGTYQGKVDGQLVVGGILTRPLLEGQISVSQGNLDLRPGEAESEPSTSAAPTEEKPRTHRQIEGIEAFQEPVLLPLPTAQQIPESEAPLLPLQFSDLDLIVGENLTVGWENLFSFTARGELMIGGNLNDLQPNGTIALLRGGIDLPIGGGFRLDRTASNTAVFDPRSGLDPLLNLQLVTRVTEVNTPPRQNSVIPGDTNPVLVNSRTIEIRATVQGRASELTQGEGRSGVVSLSSVPARDDGELLALLAATSIAAIGTGAGLAGTASQGVLTTLGEAVGLDEVRIGPTFQVDTEAANVRNVGLQAELVKDLGLNLSVSSSIPLTEPQPTRYNARFRINPNTLLRYTTDLEGNEVGAVDFEIRY